MLDGLRTGGDVDLTAAQGAGVVTIDPTTLAPDASAEQRRCAARREREVPGRSRGGLSSRVDLLADARGHPLAMVLSPGQRGDTVACAPLTAALRTARPGRPRTRPDVLLGDKAYSSAALRADLRRRAIAATIPVPADQAGLRTRRGRRGGRPPLVNAEDDEARTTVERAFTTPEAHRVVALRTDERADICAGAVAVAVAAIPVRRRNLTHASSSDTP